MFRKVNLLAVALAAVFLAAACHDNAGVAKGPEFDVGAVGGKCFSDNTCSGTAVCNLVTKICEAGEVECTSNDDCTVGEICSSGVCTADGACNGEVGCDCTASTDCKAGLECSANSTCQEKIAELVDAEVTFSDANLKAVVIASIKAQGRADAPSDKVLKKDCMNNLLITLSGAGKSINSLSGLSKCKYLKSIDLSNNNVSDVLPLAELIHLDRIQIAQNLVSDISPLKALGVLSVLDLSKNCISDYSSLASMEFSSDAILTLSDPSSLAKTPATVLTLSRAFKQIVDHLKSRGLIPDIVAADYNNCNK